MGIQGLLPLLKSIMVPIHIKDLDGCCVAVDTYSWLHKGALSCSKELCKGLPTSKHISYCMHRVNLLRHYGVKPIMVFDGGFLPMKGEQENKRARIRKESLSRAIEHESNGNQSAAYEFYQKAVDISPSVAYDLIQVLKQENVQYVVAPYEADAEMTFLAVSKQVDAIITEDSDLIAFGCPRIIYKMDKYGQGVEFQFSMLQQNKELNFTGFTKQMVLEMCILSGCDYLQSLPGMGLKKAHALMKKFRSYDKVIKHLKYNTVAVPPLYEESFKKAMMTFLHQLVYDPVTEDLVHLSELPAGADEDIEFLGPMLPPEVAKGIARGDLDPLTKLPFQKECPGTELDYSQTNQLKNFKLEGQSKKLDLPAQKNLLTNYFCIASLEAKKSFRPPRITPIDPNPEDGSPSSLLDCNAGANSCGLGSSPVSPPVPLNSSVLLEENHVSKLMDDSTTAKSSCFLETSIGIHEKEDFTDGQGMQRAPFQHSICKPCIVLHKERASGLAKSKTITENGKVVVRSSYFLPKNGKENNQESEVDLDESVCDEEPLSAASEASKGKMQTIFRKPTMRSSNSQHNSAEENDDSKMKTENRRVVVRSSYFQQQNGQDKEHGKLLAEEAEIHEPENSLSHDFYKGKSRKRKVTFNNDIETDTVRGGNILTDTSPTEDQISDEYGSATEAKSEDGKFGSNISHIGHYCEIAEKSMERFVSVISSFKFTSNGSRASGLRPPLKDIRNASHSSSSRDMDLSKYAYQPTKPRPYSVRRRTKN
ncbi:PREDICTED: exonuclease 1 [Ipomoea nil]|uniref:exonuclease 1 n=1 Tax=Ipomoea nil TaxID=35883 RepID=UPI000900EE0D|nr:PREDICTED: exonuclease 1 [Ipomoea nil]